MNWMKAVIRIMALGIALGLAILGLTMLMATSTEAALSDILVSGGSVISSSIIVNRIFGAKNILAPKRDDEKGGDTMGLKDLFQKRKVIPHTPEELKALGIEVVEIPRIEVERIQIHGTKTEKSQPK